MYLCQILFTAWIVNDDVLDFEVHILNAVKMQSNWELSADSEKLIPYKSVVF